MIKGERNMKSIRLKWLSLIVTLCVAFGAVFSAAAAFKTVKADDADVTVSVDDRYLSAGDEFSFDVSAYSETGFSSYQLKLVVPDFVKVKGITSRMGGGDAEFEYASKGYEYNITFTSDNNEYGNKTLFEVNAVVDADAQGKSGACFISDAKFTDTNVSRLSVETVGAMFYVGGNFEVMKGDFDGNGRVTIEDVMLMQRAIAYELRTTETQMQAGDIDDNGVIDIYDCQYVRSYIIGLIDSLDNIGGGGDNPHGGDDKIYGAYTHTFDEGYTVTLNLYDNHRFTEDFSDGSSSREGTFVNDGNSVYLVVGFTLERITLYPDEGIFDTFGDVNFDREPATVEGYAGIYRVNGSTEDTVAVAENGAFIRTCFEDGHQIQYNGMITLDKGDEQVNGVAYVFGNYGSEYLMAMPFTMDTKNNVIYVKQNQHNDKYHIGFYVNGEMVADYKVESGTMYNEVYNQFMKDKSDMLIKKYGAINFNDYSTNTGNTAYGDSLVTSDDNFYFFAKQQSENWTENVKIYEINNKDGEINIYYYATREDVLKALVGTSVQVCKVYMNDKGEQKSEFFKEISITADMIGDTSKIDFTPKGSSYPRIPLTIDGRAATVDLHLVPDMRGAEVIGEGVKESNYAVNGEPRVDYSLYILYDNGYIAAYSVSSKGQVDTHGYYLQYDTEDYNGTTLYVLGDPASYYVLDGTITLGRTPYQIFAGYQHADGTETTDYTLSVAGMGETVFKVFNGEFAEMHGTSPYSEELMYQGTVKVVISNGRFNFGGIEYVIGANNALSLALPQEDPILVADIGGVEAWFYEGGLAFAVYGGQPMMSFDWVGNDDLTVISYTLMGRESYFYKWAIDDKYHADEEPIWGNATVFDLTYYKDGEPIDYTLYRFKNGGDYLFDGNIAVSVDAGYQANIFDTSNNMGEGSTYYYYNANGEMYDAVRYHIELSAEQYQGEDPDRNGFGYVYAVPAKGIMVGYWQIDGDYLSDKDFTFIVNGDGDYVVSYEGSWVFTATPVAKISAMRDNKLVLVDFRNSERYFATHSGENGGDDGNNGGETHEEMYELNVYNVLNGKIQGGASYLSVESFDEFAALIDKALKDRPAEGAPVFNGYYYDINGKEPVSERNFRSGDVYLLFVQRSSDGSASGSTGE